MVQPDILANTPNVLSIGRRCVDHGYSFFWDAYSLEHYLASPKNVRIKMIVEDYIPYIITTSPAVPAVVSRAATRPVNGGGSLSPAVDDASHVSVGTFLCLVRSVFLGK